MGNNTDRCKVCNMPQGKCRARWAGDSLPHVHELDAITSPIPDELCPHVEMGEEMAGGFVFDAESPKVSVGMCALCLAICQAEFITAKPFKLYKKVSQVRFIADGFAGLWKVGDVADDLGWESTLPENDPDFVPLRLLRLRGEVLSISDPIGRGLVERI